MSSESSVPDIVPSETELQRSVEQLIGEEEPKPQRVMNAGGGDASSKKEQPKDADGNNSSKTLTPPDSPVAKKETDRKSKGGKEDFLSYFALLVLFAL